MKSLNVIKQEIFSVKDYVKDIYNIDSLYIFGSYAREEQTEKSDLDILVDFKKTPDLLTFIEIEDFLSKKLHLNVDLVPKRKLKPQLQATILKEAILI